MPDSSHVVLAVDLGTSGMKVALVTVYGEVLDWEARPIETVLTSDGGAEQSPDAWWNALVVCSTALLARELISRSRIVAVCCSTQGEGTIAIDHDGKPLMNALTWMDMRGAPHLRKQTRGIVNVVGVSPIKLARWLKLTGGMPSGTGKDPAAHMLYIRDARPEVYRDTYKFLNVLDYLNMRLTGRCVATYDSILTSWVTDNRDPSSVSYDARLVRYSGIDSEKFPALVPCTSVIGKLRASAAAELGLSCAVSVVAGSIDNTAAAIGSGAVNDKAVHLYVGTSSWLGAHVPFKKTDIFASMASVPCAFRDRYLLTALQTAAGGNLSFLRDNLLFPRDALCAQDTPNPAQLDTLAATVAAGSEGLLYTPWPWGERAPVEDRTVRAGLYNLSLRHTRAHVVRATLEGVALNTRWLIQPVEKFLGGRVDTLRIVGGGASSAIWCQIFADVLAVEIQQTVDPVQANVRGAALIAGAALGHLELADVHQLVAVKQRYEPQPQHAQVYDDQFQAFTAIYKQMRSVYRTMNTATRESRPAAAEATRVPLA